MLICCECGYVDILLCCCVYMLVRCFVQLIRHCLNIVPISYILLVLITRGIFVKKNSILLVI